MSFFGIGGKSLKKEMKEVYDKAVTAEFSDWYRNFYNKEESHYYASLYHGRYHHNRGRQDNEDESSNNDVALLAMGAMLNEQAAQQMMDEAIAETERVTFESLADIDTATNHDMEMMNNNGMM